MARPDIEKYTKKQAGPIPRTKLPDEVLQELGDLDLGIDLGQDATNPVTSSESIVDLTQQGLVSGPNFLRAYSYDKNFQASNLNLPPPSDPVTADPGIQLGQSIDPTSPKVSAEEVASVTDVNAIRRADRDIGYGSTSPVDSGDPVDRPYWYDKPSTQPLDVDGQMDKLFKSTTTFGPPTPTGPFDPNKIPSVGLPVVEGVGVEGTGVEGTGVETTVPAAGGDSLLNVLQHTDRFRPGAVPPTTAEEAVGLLSNIHGPRSDKIFHDVRDTPAVRKITGIIASLGTAAFRPGILNNPAGIFKNVAVGVGQNILAGGGGGFGFNPFTAKSNMEGIVENWDKFGFLNRISAVGYVAKLGVGLANIAEEGINTEKFIDKAANHLGKVGQHLNLLGKGTSEVVGDTENVLKALNNILVSGFIKGTLTTIPLLHGRVTQSLNEKGEPGTPGYMTGLLGFNPIGTPISIARWLTSSQKEDARLLQESWNEVNATMAGGPRVNISQADSWFETDTKVYSNGKDAYTNLHVRNLADKHYDLLANTTRLSDGAIIGKLTTSQVHSMFTGGNNPFTRYNPEGYTSDINKQLLATYKGLGGKSKNPTKEEYDRVVHKAAKSYITGFNSAINMAAGTTIVPEDKLHLSDSRNVNKALNFHNGTHFTTDEEGNVVFDAEEEREAEEGRAMTAYAKSYPPAPVQKQAPPRVVPQSSDAPEPGPAPVTPGATGPPGRGYSNIVDETGHAGATYHGDETAETWGDEEGFAGWARGGLVR